MKKLLVLLALVPALALAGQGGAAGPDAGEPGRGTSLEAAKRIQRRMQLALTMGLAEALDLTEAQALKVRDQLQNLAPRRQAAHQQLREAVRLLRRAARGDTLAAAEVDQAVTRMLDARAQLQVFARELLTSITKDQPPEKRARAVLFLARFHQRAMQLSSAGARRGRVGPGAIARPGDGPSGMADGGAWDDADTR
jgi:hypothetical protein